MYPVVSEMPVSPSFPRPRRGGSTLIELLGGHLHHFAAHGSASAGLQIYFCPSRRTASIAQDSISGDQMWLGANSYGPQIPGVLGDYAVSLGRECFFL